MLAVSPDGRCFATAADNGDIALWDAQTGTHIATLKYAGGIYSLEFLADGQLASENRDEPSLRDHPRVSIMSISGSDHASSSYTDYDAFVILDHLHCILYTKVAVLVVRFSTSFTVDCF